MATTDSICPFPHAVEVIQLQLCYMTLLLSI